jgi:hypothetical protein
MKHKSWLTLTLLAALMLPPALMPGDDAARAEEAEVPSVDGLKPLPLAFWTMPETDSQGEAVRMAYLRGFFEATHIWAAYKRDGSNPAWKYVRALQGMTIPQVSNLITRVSKEHPDLRERVSLSQAVATCTLRARVGLPFFDEADLKPASAKASKAQPPAKAP